MSNGQFLALVERALADAAFLGHLAADPEGAVAALDMAGDAADLVRRLADAAGSDPGALLQALVEAARQCE